MWTSGYTGPGDFETGFRHFRIWKDGRVSLKSLVQKLPGDIAYAGVGTLILQTVVARYLRARTSHATSRTICGPNYLPFWVSNRLIKG